MYWDNAFTNYISYVPLLRKLHAFLIRYSIYICTGTYIMNAFNMQHSVITSQN